MVLNLAQNLAQFCAQNSKCLLNCTPGHEILEVVVDLSAEDDWVEGEVVERGQGGQRDWGEGAAGGVAPGE